jgi:hypothetical protein
MRCWINPATTAGVDISINVEVLVRSASYGHINIIYFPVYIFWDGAFPRSVVFGKLAPK